MEKINSNQIDSDDFNLLEAMAKVVRIAKVIVTDSGSHSPTLLVFSDSEMNVVEISLPEGTVWEQRQKFFADMVDNLRSQKPDFFVFAGTLGRVGESNSILLIYGKEQGHSISIVISYEKVNGTVFFHEAEMRDSFRGELTIGILDAVFEPLN